MIKRKAAKYKQGSFSNLCGLYAIINALHELFGTDFKKDNAKSVFKDMLRHIEAEYGAYATLKNGTTPKEMRKLIGVAKRRVNAQESGPRLSKIGRLPYKKRDGVGEVFSRLGKELGPECVAVIGFEGSEDHWAVATKVNAVDGSSELEIFDSDSGTKRNSESIQIGSKSKLERARKMKRSDRPLFIMPKQIFLLRVVK